MVDTGGQHRPGHIARHFRNIGAGFRRARIGNFQNLRAQLQAQARAALDQRREFRLVLFRAFTRQRIGQELDHQQHILCRKIGNALADDAGVMRVRVRMVGAQIDHQLAPRAAELAHAPRGDARREARTPVAALADIIAGRVKADQQRHVARQRRLFHHARHGADGVEQHAGRMGGEMAHNVGLDIAQHRVGHRRLRRLVGAEQLADAAALVAGDDHDRAARPADLLIAAQFGRGHFRHAAANPVIGRRSARLLLSGQADVIDFHKGRDLGNPAVAHKGGMIGMIIIACISCLIREFH